MSQILTYRMWQVHNRHIAFRKFQKPTYGCWGKFTHGRHLSQEFDLTMSQRRFFPQQRYRSWHCHVAINRLNINAISTFHLFNFIRRYLERNLKKLKGISSIWYIVAREHQKKFHMTYRGDISHLRYSRSLYIPAGLLNEVLISHLRISIKINIWINIVSSLRAC